MRWVLNILTPISLTIESGTVAKAVFDSFWIAPRNRDLPK